MIIKYAEPKVKAVHTVVIPGHPTPWARAGRQTMSVPGRKPWVHSFDPAKNRIGKRDVRVYFYHAGALSDPPPEGPIRMTMAFYVARPKRLMRSKDPAEPIPTISRPDLDNYEKLVLDALNTAGYKDDSQVYERRGIKLFCEKGGQPRTEIYMEIME